MCYIYTHMSNTFTWEFPTLQTYTTQSGQLNVVSVVHWRLNATDETEKYTTGTYGSQQLAAYVSGSAFTAYPELTKATITSWVLDAMGEQYGNYTASLNSQIETLKNPPVQYLTPPWVPTGSVV